MYAITGLVSTVTLKPGRPDILTVALADGSTYMIDSTGVVSADGTPVTGPELFAWLLKVGRITTVTLHPRSDRYGLADKSEFVSC